MSEPKKCETRDEPYRDEDTDRQDRLEREANHLYAQHEAKAGRAPAPSGERTIAGMPESFVNAMLSTFVDPILRAEPCPAAPEMLSATERYERDAAQFYDDTGFIAPGKDVPAAMGGESYETRAGAFRAWLRLRDRLVDKDALDALREAVRGCGQTYHNCGYHYRCGEHIDVEVHLCGRCALRRDAATSTLLRGANV